MSRVHRDLNLAWNRVLLLGIYLHSPPWFYHPNYLRIIHEFYGVETIRQKDRKMTVYLN
jgi:hypothetical protein